jgi:AcrR family transcriptional regulator
MTTQSLRQKHVDRTRQAIIEAAFALFAERGFGATTVDDIAERADVAPRTFFRYFPTKESVLFHDTDSKVETIRERLAERPAGEPVAQSLLAIFRKMASELANDRERAQLLCRLSLETEGLLSSRRRQMIDQFSAAIVEVVSERDGNTQDDVALRAMAAAVVACGATAIHCWLDDGAEGDLQPYIDKAIAACRDAFEADARIQASNGAA